LERVRLADLEKGELTASWGLEASHPTTAPEEVAKQLKAVLIGMLLSSVKGSWEVSDEMNRMFPDFEFTDMEAFLTKVWA